MFKLKFTKKQLERTADQTRLLSWAQGAMITSTSGLHLQLSVPVIILTVTLWISLQFLALQFDKWSEI